MKYIAVTGGMHGVGWSTVMYAGMHGVMVSEGFIIASFKIYPGTSKYVYTTLTY